MRSILWILLAAAVAFAMPTELWGQGQGHGQGRGRGRGHARADEASVRFDRDDRDRKRDRHDRLIRGRTVVRIDDLEDLDDLDDDEVLLLRANRGRTVVIDRGDVLRRFPVTTSRSRGPAFCRSGAGHPVWGPEWCLEKGFGLGGTRRIVLGDDRVIFRVGQDVVLARGDVWDDRSWIERTIDRVLFWVD